jgi:hypothetical protein
VGITFVGAEQAADVSGIASALRLEREFDEAGLDRPRRRSKRRR